MANITDSKFWDANYFKKNPHYFLCDPLYGKNGLLAKTLSPWLQNNRSVLELGCGSSRFLMFFNRVAGLETFGIDFSNEGLKNLRKMSKNHEIHHQLVQGDMFKHDLGGRKFDVVFHSGLVEHFSDLDLFFKRCRFFCKENGLMIFMMPNMQNRAWSWHKHICPDNYQAHILYDMGDIIDPLSKYFKIIKHSTWGYPQIYAGGPPETLTALMAKYANLSIIALISIFVFGYHGRVNDRWASTRLMIATTR